MNNKTLPFCLSLLLISATFLWAEEAAKADTAPAAETEVEEEKVLPTEISEPPYEIGQLVTIQGYYIEGAEGEPSLNFRFTPKGIRVYWIDKDGLIAEPKGRGGNVRFTQNLKGKSFFGLTPLPSGAGLGSNGVVPLPHVFNVVLVIESLEEAEQFESHYFRFTPAMDVETDPEIPTPESSGDTE